MPYVRGRTHTLFKFLKIREFVDRQLNRWLDANTNEAEKTYLYISNNKVIGCLVVEQISHGFPIILETGGSTTDNTIGGCRCSHTPRRAILGVSRLWVQQDNRRRGVATRLLDAARRNFSFATTEVPKEECAFAQPTASGAAFAEKYVGSAQFLVFVRQL